MQPLRILAVLFGLLVVSNFLKPLELSAQTGFVFMGRRLEGTPNLIAAWSFAVFLAWYAASLWREKAAALPLGIAYAAYVSANLFLFALRMPAPTGNARLFGLAYTVVALGCAWGAVVLMIRSGFAAMDRSPGRILLRSFALLFAWMALSNTLKPFATSAETGFVLLGHRLAGTPNTVAALTFAALLARCVELLQAGRLGGAAHFRAAVSGERDRRVERFGLSALETQGTAALSLGAPRCRLARGATGS
jgi:hypothetical protein